MNSLHYPWKRLWCPREGNLNLSDRGYLWDPEWLDLSGFDKSQLRSLDKLQEIPCLVLLGEPGIGKSTAIEESFSLLKPSLEAQGDLVKFFNLGNYGNEDRLILELFRNEQIRLWKDSGHRLHLFLDSLDEGRLRIDQLASVLSTELRDLPIERLHLRITCRTAEWPAILEDNLKGMWAVTSADNETHNPKKREAPVQVFELAPLRRRDVEEALRLNGLDPEKLMEEIEKKDAVPFAIKPVTLGLLINLLKKEEQMPNSRVDLYSQGLELLCNETDTRRHTKLEGTLEPNQRLMIAGRIAAATIFGNRFAVWNDLDRGDVPPEDVVFSDLSGGSETVKGNQYNIRGGDIKEVLRTGLFTSRGPIRMGWFHQTYAEFLAAWYLVQHDMSVDQILNLIVHPEDASDKFVPQLHQTVGWLVELRPQLFGEVSEREPALILGLEIDLDYRQRFKLVAALLDGVKTRKLHIPRLRSILDSSNLKHPEIGNQLRPYLIDEKEDFFARRTAMDLAISTAASDLSDELACIALNKDERYGLRSHAAWAISRIGSTEARLALKELAIDSLSDDPDDQLKGYALAAVWPEHISSVDLFRVLTPPKRRSVFGGYYCFLIRDICEHLTAEHLVDALDWVQKQGRQEERNHAFEELIGNLLQFAWENTEHPGVLDQLALTLLKRSADHQPVMGKSIDKQSVNPFESNHIARRKLILAMLQNSCWTDNSTYGLVVQEPQIVLPNDLDWILANIQSSTSSDERARWADILAWLRHRLNTEQQQTLIESWRMCPELEAALNPVFGAVELDSERASMMKRDWAHHKKTDSENEPGLLPPPPEQCIQKDLQDFENGEYSVWWKRLVRNISLEPQSSGNRYRINLTESHGWKSADASTRLRIISAAGRYVFEHTPSPQEWFASNIYHRPDISGLKALCLLYTNAPEVLDAIGNETWKRWAPVLVGYVFYEHEDKPILANLLQRAYEQAPEQVLEYLERMVEYESSQFGYPRCLPMLDLCWDERIADVLLKKIKAHVLKKEYEKKLLLVLLEKRSPLAVEYAKEILNVRQFEEVPLALTAAEGLLRHSDGACWSIVWQVIQKDSRFARDLFESVAFRFRIEKDSFISRLSPEVSADLYLWLVERYPHDEDPKFDEICHGVSTREEIGYLRDAILTGLVGLGTPEACKAVRRIANALPNLSWLNWSALQAEDNLRLRTWIPPKPQDIIELAQRADRRIVQSGDQLLDVITESLHRLQEKIGGRVRLLWDQLDKKTQVWRPKEENDLSDFVKIHLDTDLRQRPIIVNREVQVKRGDETDIKVDAIRQDSGGAPEVYSLIIETKGCWHGEVHTAMKSQLVDRYLKENGFRHGLYLVGWYDCSKWDPAHKSKISIPWSSIEEAQEALNKQAAALSEEGYVVRAFVLDVRLPDKQSGCKEKRCRR